MGNVRSTEFKGSENDPLVLDFLSGMTQKAIGLKHGKSLYAVNAYLMRRRSTVHPKLVELTKEALYQHYKDGLKDLEIGQLYGVYFQELTRHKRILGIDNATLFLYRAMIEAKSGRAIDLDEIKKLYLEERWGSLKISKYFGFNGDTAIRGILREMGILRKDGEHQLNISREEYDKLQATLNSGFIEQKYAEGLTTYEIADLLKVNGIFVQRYLRRNKIKARSPLDYLHKRGLGKPHERLIQILDELGIKHETSKVLRFGKKTFEFDEYLPELNLYIEVQGLYWHGFLQRSKDHHNIKQNVNRDRVKFAMFRENIPARILYLTEDRVEQVTEYLDFGSCCSLPLEKEIT